MQSEMKVDAQIGPGECKRAPRAGWRLRRRKELFRALVREAYAPERADALA